jgi:hypothetical protein
MSPGARNELFPGSPPSSSCANAEPDSATIIRISAAAAANGKMARKILFIGSFPHFFGVIPTNERGFGPPLLEESHTIKFFCGFRKESYLVD